MVESKEAVRKSNYGLDRNNYLVAGSGSVWIYWPVDQRLFARRMSGLDCAGLYRRCDWDLVGASAASAGTVSDPHRHDRVSDHMVNYRSRVVRSGDITNLRATRVIRRLELNL